MNNKELTVNESFGHLLCVQRSLKMLVGAIALVVVGSNQAVAQGGGPAPVFTVSDLPQRLYTGIGGAIVYRGYQRGTINFRASAKRLNIEWISSSLTNSEPIVSDYILNANGRDAWGTSEYKSETQTINTNFCITACGRLDATTLIVAGVHSKKGETIIEKWALGWPGASPNPVFDPNTGTDTVEIVIPSVSKSRIYTGPPVKLASHKFVSGIVGIRNESSSLSTKAVVHFDSPNDVFELDIATGQLSLLGSEVLGTGSLGILQTLSIKEYSSIKVMNHASMGYVYFIKVGNPDIHIGVYGGTNLTDNHIRLFLKDANRDGVIDAAPEMSTVTAESGGYLILEDYQDYWLE